MKYWLTASRGIAEVITHHYTQNIDLKDAKTVLSNGGTAHYRVLLQQLVITALKKLLLQL